MPNVCFFSFNSLGTWKPLIVKGIVVIQTHIYVGLSKGSCIVQMGIRRGKMFSCKLQRKRNEKNGE